MAYRDVSIVIPVSESEDPEAVQQLVSNILMDHEVAEILVITEADTLSFPLAVNERVRVRQQNDPREKKTGALNDGLAMSRSQYTIFIDSDVLLSGDEIGITRQLLEDGANFVGAGYGKRSSFPLLSPTSGWFFGCRTSVFRDAGGWKGDGLNEDVVTIRGLQKQGYRIVDGGFTVQLRRGVRQPLTKFLGAMFGR